MRYLIISYLLNIIDYLFTAYWVKLYGIEIEGNPIGRWTFEHNVAWVFKIFVVGFFLALIGVLTKNRPRYAWIPFVPLLVYGVIVLYHIIIYFSLTTI